MYTYKIIRTIISSLFLAALFYSSAEALTISAPTTVYTDTFSTVSWAESFKDETKNISQWGMYLVGNSGPTNFAYLRTVSPQEQTKSIRWSVPTQYSGSNYRICFMGTQGCTFSNYFTIGKNGANTTPVITAMNPTVQYVTLPANKATYTVTATDDKPGLTYVWKQINPTTPLSSIVSSGNTATMTATVAGTYNYEVIVTDSDGMSTKGAAALILSPSTNSNTAPVISSITNPYSIQLPQIATLTAIATDAQSTVTYKWQQTTPATGAVFSNANSSTTNVSFTTPGVYQFRVTVTDTAGASTSRDTQVTVNAANVGPLVTIAASPSSSIQLPTSTVTLTATATDSDGIKSYAWSKVGTGLGTISSGGTTKTASITGLTAVGSYRFQVVVTDTKNAATTQFIDIAVTAQPNRAPTVVTNPATQMIQLPTNTATLSAVGSDLDGNVLTYAWTRISGPNTPTFTASTSATTGVTGLIAGTYEFLVTVKDPSQASATAVAKVEVKAANVGPSVTISATPGTSIQLPISNIALTANASDSDGIGTYVWKQNTGPKTTILGSSSLATTTVTGLTSVGSYQFQVTVSDTKGLTTVKVIDIAVTAQANTPPTVLAIASQTIKLPTNKATFTAVATDNKTGLTYVWTQISPTTPVANISQSSASPSATMTVTTPGVYTFMVKVTDSDGASVNTNAVLTVTAANVAPTVSITSSPISPITLPINTAQLTANATDSDGSIATYKWSKVSGGTAIITNDTTRIATISNLVEGDYVFSVSITDNENASASGSISIKVLAAGETDLWSGVPFTFTVDSDLTTSAGVYKKDGTLVRTLWGGVDYKKGTYTEVWDGTGDDGELIVDGDYDIKVLTNNVQYEWEGVVGNTSKQKSGQTVSRGRYITSMAIVGGVAYTGKGQSEGTPSHEKILLSDPNGSKRIVTMNTATDLMTSLDVEFIASDGQRVYWGGQDAWAVSQGKPSTLRSLVFATTIAPNFNTNDTEYIFTKGASQKLGLGYTYQSAISIVTDNPKNEAAELTKMSGMAVQKNGKYLFVSYAERGELRVIDKLTGEIIKTITTFVHPRTLAVDNNDNLLVTSGNEGASKIEKFTVSSVGALSSATMTISGLSNPLGMAVSPDVSTTTPDEKTLLIADAGSSQQLKAFNVDTGASLWTYGVKAGYAVDATVAYDKFYFSNARINHRTFVAFDPKDGTFWVGDSGNGRAIHYNLDRTFKEEIMQTGIVYSMTVDQNDSTRVFEDFLEFKVDYSKPLQKSATESYGGSNGSWKLVKNWGYNVPQKYISNYNTLRSVATITRSGITTTYSTLKNNDTNKGREIVELPAGGQLRFTGMELNSTTQLYGDGSLRDVVTAVGSNLGKPQSITSRMITGINTSNKNPILATGTTVLAQTPGTTNLDPIYFGNPTKLSAGEITSSGLVIMNNAEIAPPAVGQNYHLGAVNQGGNQWLWKVAPGTRQEYKGPFPTDGSFDEGNSVEYAGIRAVASNKNIFWGYHGEFWKAAQTNLWNHVYDNGLLVGQFGIAGPDRLGSKIADRYAYPEYAGNAFSPAVTIGTDGNTYLYHNDEGHHAGAHRWKVTGLNTIKEAKIGVTLSTEANGLLAQYYAGTDLDSVELNTTRIDPSVNFVLGTAPIAGTTLTNAASSSYRWDGFVEAPASGNYNFYANAAGGVKLLLDNEIMIDETGNASQKEYSSTPPTTTTTGPTITAKGTGTTPPTILVPNVTLGRTKAFIKWYTNASGNNQSTSGQVEYGLTTNYGSITPVYEKVSITSEVWLHNLRPDTVYHYRLISVNPKTGDTATSIDRTFRTTPITLVAGERYPIRLEAAKGGIVSLSWSGPGITKQVIPMTRLYPTVPPDVADGSDLMEGLPYNMPLQSGQYGWTRTPAAERDNKNDIWNVKLGIKTHDRRTSPDLYFKFLEPSNTTNTVTRDLGTQNVATNWSLSGYIAFEGDSGNTSTGGMYVEVLDTSGRIISRLYTVTDSGKTVQSMVSNGTSIFQKSFDEFGHIVDKLKPFKVSVANGKVTTSYGTYSSVTTNMLDAAADWKKPKTLRLYATQGNFTNLYQRSVTLDEVHFLAK